MSQQHTAYYASEIGMLQIIGTEEGILSVCFVDDPKPRVVQVHQCLQSCVAQLGEYFGGKRREFSIPLLLTGTSFEKQVWQALRAIPYGQTKSYGDIARAIGHEKAARAVGNANRRNRLAVIIPCHRVIGSDGSLVGYYGGLPLKRRLLNLERSHTPVFQG